jgi:hypothetical protein
VDVVLPFLNDRQPEGEPAMKLLSALLISVVMCATSNAYAVVETNKTPMGMGIRPSANSAYFFVAETLITACGANVIWIVLDAAGLGKTAYASVLAAKVTGKKLSYLEYTQDVFGNCYLVQVEIAA